MTRPVDGPPPLVSVIMPVFNAASFLDESLGSVLAQSRPDWELLAVDDGSTDGSAARLAGWAARDPRIRVLATGGNKGAGAARNCAFERARGRYLAFLDADDQWHPDKLALQIEAMQRAGIPFSCTAYLRRDNQTGRETVVGVPPLASRSALLKTNTVACSTAVIDRAHFGPRQMPELRRRQDFLFWLDLLHSTPAVLGLPTVLMTYRVHGQSLSASKRQAASDTWDMYRRSLGLPLPKAAWYFGHYALRGVLRHRMPGVARSIGLLHGATRPEGKRT